MRVPPNSSLDDLRDSVHALLCDAFRGCLDKAVPLTLIPQLHNCCAQVVAEDGTLGVAVIFDLSRVGGAVFAAVVARVLQEADLIPFVRPLTRADVEEYAFYIGSFGSPAASGEYVRPSPQPLLFRQHIQVLRATLLAVTTGFEPSVVGSAALGAYVLPLGYRSGGKLCPVLPCPACSALLPSCSLWPCPAPALSCRGLLCPVLPCPALHPSCSLSCFALLALPCRLLPALAW